MAAVPSADNLLLGAGEVYYAMYDNLGVEGTTRHLGHCSAFSLQVEVISKEIPYIRTAITDLPRYKIVGFKVKGSVTMDDMSAVNLAGFLAGGVDSSHVQAASTNSVTLPYTVVKGTWIGLYDTNDIMIRHRVFGTRLIDVYAGATHYVAGRDYVYHARAGFLYIPTTSTMVANTSLYISYDIPAAVINQISIASSDPNPGRLTFIGDPTTGPAYMVTVKSTLNTSTGPVRFIGEDFASVSIEFEALDHSGKMLDGTTGFWDIVELPPALV